MKFKVHELQLSNLKKRLDLLPPQFEHVLCNKYGVCDLELLKATDYDEIMDTINDYIYKMKFEIIN